LSLFRADKKERELEQRLRQISKETSNTRESSHVLYRLVQTNLRRKPEDQSHEQLESDLQRAKSSSTVASSARALSSRSIVIFKTLKEAQDGYEAEKRRRLQIEEELRKLESEYLQFRERTDGDLQDRRDKANEYKRRIELQSQHISVFKEVLEQKDSLLRTLFRRHRGSSRPDGAYRHGMFFQHHLVLRVSPLLTTHACALISLAIRYEIVP
jgi:hypothetical protein